MSLPHIDKYWTRSISLARAFPCSMVDTLLGSQPSLTASLLPLSPVQVSRSRRSSSPRSLLYAVDAVMRRRYGLYPIQEPSRSGENAPGPGSNSGRGPDLSLIFRLPFPVIPRLPSQV